MKKGFTMIELIFVIVILGILASVAIPRLAATREDAEISTTIANLRTLVSEASSYYVAHGTFGSDTDGATWNDVTNVPLVNTSDVSASTTTATTAAYLAAGKKSCIGVQLVNKDGDTPAHIKFTKNTTNNTTNTVCKQVLDSEPVDAYFKSKAGSTENAVPVGSSKGIYKSVTKPEPSSS